MSTKSQRRMKRIAARHGEKFALERSVLSAARVLMGSIRKYGREAVPWPTWERFYRAESRLQDFHAERQRKRNVR